MLVAADYGLVWGGISTNMQPISSSGLQFAVIINILVSTTAWVGTNFYQSIASSELQGLIMFAVWWALLMLMFHYETSITGCIEKNHKKARGHDNHYISTIDNWRP